MTSTNFPDPKTNLLEFLGFLKGYAVKANLKKMIQVLNAAPDSFGQPPTDDYFEILKALDAIDDTELSQLPNDLRDGIVETRRGLRKILSLSK